MKFPGKTYYFELNLVKLPRKCYLKKIFGNNSPLQKSKSLTSLKFRWNMPKIQKSIKNFKFVLILKSIFFLFFLEICSILSSILCVTSVRFGILKSSAQNDVIYIFSKTVAILSLEIFNSQLTYNVFWQNFQKKKIHCRRIAMGKNRFYLFV